MYTIYPTDSNSIMFGSKKDGYLMLPHVMVPRIAAANRQLSQPSAGLYHSSAQVLALPSLGGQFFFWLRPWSIGSSQISQVGMDLHKISQHMVLVQQNLFHEFWLVKP